jgi:hypothetical protein
MIRRFTLLATLVALAAVPAGAHDVVRITGTITKCEPAQLGVKTKVGRTVYVELTKTTIVLRGTTKVPAASLKPGMSVVVDARGNDDSDLAAKQVRIVAAAAPPARSGPG